MKLRTLAAAWLLALAAAPSLAAQTGTTERHKLHARSLEGNLSGDSPVRDVSVYLPPSYATQPGRRFPVVYLLHGFTDNDAKFFGLEQHWMNLPTTLDRAIAGGASEMIVVMPNAYTRFAGSMYSSSATNGDWESFVARELVAFVDGRYRTLARPESRGLAGHSMGGYGTLRIAMKHPDVFSAIYAMNPCCLGASVTPPPSTAPTGPSAAERVRTAAEFEAAPFGVKAQLASAAAWSPNPANPPFYVDLPTKDGVWRPEVAAKWAANAPLAMLDQYLFSLRRLRAIGLDAGTQEASIGATTRAFHDALDRYGIANAFEIYEGGHIDRVAERIEKTVMPFFSRHLLVAPVR